jgi:hypothetical protein
MKSNNSKLFALTISAFIVGIALGVSADVTITTAPSNAFISLTSPETDKLLGAVTQLRQGCIHFNTHLDASTLTPEDWERLMRFNDSSLRVDAAIRETILKDFPCAQLSEPYIPYVPSDK